MKHTPTPWILSKGNFCIRVANGPVVCEASEHGNTWSNEQDWANLEFIARACNAHDELVTRLTIAVEQMAAHPGLFDPTTMQVHRAALAKAEGR